MINESDTVIHQDKSKPKYAQLDNCSKGLTETLLDLKLSVEEIQAFINQSITYASQNNRTLALGCSMDAYAYADALKVKFTTMLKLLDFQKSSLPISRLSCQDLFADFDRHYLVKCKSKPKIVWTCSGYDNIQGSFGLDKELFQAILFIAIDNAIKFTAIGFVRVTYKIDHNTLKVEVHDTGVGMSESTLSKTLSSFGDVFLDHDELISMRGYPLMKVLCKKIQASFTVDSKPEFGTKINFNFPIKDYDPSAIQTKLFTTYVHNIRQNAFKVLVLESDAISLHRLERLLSTEYLRREDVETTFTQDAAEAIALIEEKSFCLIFIDYHNENMDIVKFFEFVDSLNIEHIKSKIILLIRNEIFPLPLNHIMYKYCDNIYSKELSAFDIRYLVRKNSLRVVS
jgi:CheY-like chemotaxis protein